MSGTLQASVIKDEASATNNLTLNTSGGVTVGQNLTVAGTSTTTGTAVMGSSYLRNRIINGAMQIDQRNAGASVTPTDGQYLLDRWVASLTAASKYTAQQSATAPTGFSNSLVITSSSAYSVAAGDIFAVQQKIEGFNFYDMAWGTASAQTVTLSFWVRSSLTGTFGGSFLNSATNRSYPFTYTISSANTWTQISVTVPGDTSGTWVGATNGLGVRVYFGLGVGSTYSGTAGSWSGSTYFSATGATSVVGTSGATFYITGVQLEVGTVATPFERRLYGQELALCQRYYCKSFDQSTAPAQNAGLLGSVYFQQGVSSSIAAVATGVRFPVQMRSAPTTITIYNPSAANAQIRNITTATDWTLTATTAVGESGFAVTGTTPAAAGTNSACAYHYSASAEI